MKDLVITSWEENFFLSFDKEMENRGYGMIDHLDC